MTKKTLTALALFIMLIFTQTAFAYEIDPDAALSRVCDKFKARFQLMEQMAAEEERNGGKPLSGRSLAELDALWDKAKEQLAVRATSDVR